MYIAQLMYITKKVKVRLYLSNLVQSSPLDGINEKLSPWIRRSRRPCEEGGAYWLQCSRGLLCLFHITDQDAKETG